MTSYMLSLRKALLIIFLGASGLALQAQSHANITVGGPCMNCTDHLLATAKAIKGVTSAKFDPATSMLMVDYAAGTSEVDISLELSMAGYDAGDFKRDANAKMPACCGTGMRGDDDMDDLDDLSDDEIGDWESPNSLDALDKATGTGHTVNEPSIDDLDKDDDSDLNMYLDDDTDIARGSDDDDDDDL